MADFLLVHGAAHGAWCWRDIVPALTKLGHSVRTIDLPGHGGDLTPIDAITLDAYADAILGAIDTPVILVGHSMGGYPISLAADRMPSKIRRLIYLCAFFPDGDLTLAQRRKATTNQELLPVAIMSEDGKSFRFDPAKSRDMFYHDCPEGTTAYANARLCAQSMQPYTTPCLLGPAYRSVPRSYIRCVHDRVVPLDSQLSMTSDWPAGDVHELQTGHSPFFADPDGLANLLDHIAAQDG